MVAFSDIIDFLLRLLQCRLTLPRELHAALEFLQRLLERQVAALETRDERFELLERFFESADAGFFGSAHRGAVVTEGATVHSVLCTVKRCR